DVYDRGRHVAPVQAAGGDDDVRWCSGAAIRRLRRLVLCRGRIGRRGRCDLGLRCQGCQSRADDERRRPAPEPARPPTATARRLRDATAERMCENVTKTVHCTTPFYFVVLL